jgi:hypothetical protein
LSDLQLKNYVESQLKQFKLAMEKKGGTGFGDVVGKNGEQITAKQQLLKICRHWYAHSNCLTFRDLLFPLLKDNPSSAPLGGLGDDGLENPPDMNNDNGSHNGDNAAAYKLPQSGDTTGSDTDNPVESARRYMAGIDKQTAEEGLLNKYKTNNSGTGDSSDDNNEDNPSSKCKRLKNRPSLHLPATRNPNPQPRIFRC